VGVATKAASITLDTYSKEATIGGKRFIDEIQHGTRRVPAETDTENLRVKQPSYPGCLPLSLARVLYLLKVMTIPENGSSPLLKYTRLINSCACTNEPIG